MSASATAIQLFRPTPLDDELAALTLQLEELGLFSRTEKGKYTSGHLPDAEVAFTNFQNELEDYKAFLGDQKLAQSIGAAVHSDGLLIGDITSQDVLAHEDHRIALQLSNNDPEIESPPRDAHVGLQHEVGDWMSTASGNIAAASVVEFSDDETDAGPSMTFTESQADIMEQPSTEFQCCVCTDRFPRALVVTAKCNDCYCVGCIKRLFLRSTKDEGLYPPKCCRQPIPLGLVAKHMEPEERAAFELATIEYATRNRTYCSNHSCGMFIVTGNIEPGTERATCSECGTDTCAICKNEYHQGSDCPPDPSLQQTRELARNMGWQTCSTCDRVVQLRSGCNHIT